MRASSSQLSFGLFGGAAFLLAFAVGVDVLFQDVPGLRAQAHVSAAPLVTRGVPTRSFLPPPRRAGRDTRSGMGIAFLELHCDSPVSVETGDGVRYPDRFEAAIPVRAGTHRVRLQGAHRSEEVSVSLQPGDTARLPCP